MNSVPRIMWGSHPHNDQRLEKSKGRFSTQPASISSKFNQVRDLTPPSFSTLTRVKTHNSPCLNPTCQGLPTILLISAPILTVLNPPSAEPFRSHLTRFDIGAAKNLLIGPVELSGDELVYVVVAWRFQWTSKIRRGKCRGITNKAGNKIALEFSTWKITPLSLWIYEWLVHQSGKSCLTPIGQTCNPFKLQPLWVPFKPFLCSDINECWIQNISIVVENAIPLQKTVKKTLQRG
jgi:hypothetical protein